MSDCGCSRRRGGGASACSAVEPTIAAAAGGGGGRAGSSFVTCEGCGKAVFGLTFGFHDCTGLAAAIAASQRDLLLGRVPPPPPPTPSQGGDEDLSLVNGGSGRLEEPLREPHPGSTPAAATAVATDARSSIAKILPQVEEKAEQEKSPGLEALCAERDALAMELVAAQSRVQSLQATADEHASCEALRASAAAREAALLLREAQREDELRQLRCEVQDLAVRSSHLELELCESREREGVAAAEAQSMWEELLLLRAQRRSGLAEKSEDIARKELELQRVRKDLEACREEFRREIEAIRIAASSTEDDGSGGFEPSGGVLVLGRSTPADGRAARTRSASCSPAKLPDLAQSARLWALGTNPTRECGDMATTATTMREPLSMGDEMCAKALTVLKAGPKLAATVGGSAGGDRNLAWLSGSPSAGNNSEDSDDDDLVRVRWQRTRARAAVRADEIEDDAAAAEERDGGGSQQATTPWGPPHQHRRLRKRLQFFSLVTNEELPDSLATGVTTRSRSKT
eukprot:SM000160S02517  [mRNA]  locus=s160:31942:34261:+ [translate_table: standard]